MTPTFLLVCAAKDLRRRLRDIPALLIWIGVPVMIGGMLSLLATGGSDGIPRARVLLVDQDDTFLSGLIAGASEQGGLGEFLEVESVALEDGRERIDAGEATALLILPAGLQEAILQEEPATVTLITNPAQRILPGIVREGLEIMIELVFYLQRLLGDPLRMLVEGPPDGGNFFDNETVARISQVFNDKARRLESVLFPPVLKVVNASEEAAAEPQESFNFGSIFLPGMLFMSILFIANGMASDVWEEREAGTLARFASTPRALAALIGGKVLASGALMGLTVVGGLLVGAWAFALSPWRIPAASLWGAYVGMTLLCLFMLLQTLASGKRTAEMISTTVMFPFLMIGGSFFPFEIMPAWMAAAGRWTPNGLGVTVLRQIIDGAVEPTRFAVAVGVLTATAALAFFLVVRRLGDGSAGV